jgi:RimJ/RimL family protein N-acetyltransferase
VKFILSSKEVFKSELRSIPWANAFLHSKILVVCVDDGSFGAVCGIRSVFNILTLYVCEQWRGRGIGNQILAKTISMARERRLGFILLGVFYDNVRAFRLYSRFGFREVVYLKKPGLRVMMLPMDFLGEFAYVFLRGVTLLLPNMFWTYVAQWVHDRTVSDDKGG